MDMTSVEAEHNNIARVGSWFVTNKTVNLVY